MRKLVTLRKIKSLQPIDGADKIEKATIDGWTVVVRKGEFKEGDDCVFFEIDSLLPNEQPFEFLKFNGRPSYRLKTVKLKGCLSQGLALPLSNFSPAITAYLDDLDTFLNVTKYEPPITNCQLRGDIKGNFPSFLRKTDEERIQNISERDLESWLDLDFVETAKFDGSSMTIYVKNKEDRESDELKDIIGVCSRNVEIKYNEDNAFWQAAKVFIENSEWDVIGSVSGNPDICAGIAFQGELMGPGVQGNKLGLDYPKFFLFNIYDYNKGEYFPPEWISRRVNDFNYSYRNINSVPTSSLKPLRHFGVTREDFIARADALNMSTSHGEAKVFHEGIVYKCNSNPGISFKVISNNYLLKESA